VLRPGGRLIVAVPAPEDLIELRGAGRNRVAAVRAEFAQHFHLDAQERVTTAAELDAEGVADVLLSIYRPLQPGPARAGRVTLSLDLLRFRPQD